jgi:alpha-L-fucosidase
MGFSYGYNRMETLGDYHTTRELLLMLIDIVSRGGNLLLDIGPTADGRIPVIMEERLTEMGSWLRPNAEAIYGTSALAQGRQWSPGTVPQFDVKEFNAAYDITKMVDAPPAGYARVDAFFTTKGDTIYALLPRRPDAQILLESMIAGAGAKITLLESGDELQWRVEGTRVRVEVPESVRSKLPYREVYALKMAGFSRS